MDLTDVPTRVDTYLTDLFDLVDLPLSDALRHSEAEGLPRIQITAAQGQLLRILALAVGARRILEVGTLGGFSTAFLARGVGRDGTVVSLELEPAHARVARRNLEGVGVADRVRVVEGDAHESLARMIDDSVEPFDLVFLDAEKHGYPDYLEATLRLSHPGTLVVADNVVRGGAVLEETSDDPDVVGVREFLRRVAEHPLLTATVVQTVGDKGYDGFLLAVVRAHADSPTATAAPAT